MDDVGELAFDIAGVEASIAYHLQAFGRDMGDHVGDKVKSRASDGDALVDVGVDVPIGDLLTVVVGDVRSGEWGVAQVTPDVLGGSETLGIETVGIDLKATVIAVALLNRLS